MRITHVRTFPVVVPLRPERLMLTSLGLHDVSRYLLVRVETDAGVDGAGEATTMLRWSGESMWGAQALIEHVIAPRLAGCDPRDIHRVNEILDAAAWGNWFAKAAIEMACWDIRGKEEGKPVYELLGGAVRDATIRCRFSMGAFDPPRAAELARELVAEGFTTLKIKVGSGIEADLARIRAVREAADSLKAELQLVLDANAAYEPAVAIELANRTEEFGIGLFEQPTPRGDFAGLAEVRRAIRPQVMADELCFDLADVRNCVRHEACDVIGIYPGKNGGIAKSLHIAEYAAEHGLACSLGSNLELDVGTAAMAHLTRACPNLQVEKYPGDMLGPSYHAASIAKNPIAITGPFVECPTGPGLGVEVDWAAVERHAAK
ncbi:MAG: enolase C-terminal domain-like protein [Planctomycetales bacterium]